MQNQLINQLHLSWQTDIVKIISTKNCATRFDPAARVSIGKLQGVSNSLRPFLNIKKINQKAILP